MSLPLELSGALKKLRVDRVACCQSPTIIESPHRLVPNYGFGLIARRVPEVWETNDFGWLWVTGCVFSFLAYSTEATISGIIRPPGQIKLKQSSVVVVGAGGLGCPALQYLAAAGIGEP